MPHGTIALHSRLPTRRAIALASTSRSGGQCEGRSVEVIVGVVDDARPLVPSTRKESMGVASGLSIVARRDGSPNPATRLTATQFGMAPANDGPSKSERNGGIACARIIRSGVSDHRRDWPARKASSRPRS